MIPILQRKSCGLLRAAALLIFLAGMVSRCPAQWTPLNPVTDARQQADGVILAMKSGVLKVLVCSDSVVHVL
jgi:hypothetical protein